MLIDCDTCTVRGSACGGCMVNTLLTATAEASGRESEETAAIEALTRAGFEVTVIEAARPRSVRRRPRRRSRAA